MNDIKQIKEFIHNRSPNKKILYESTKFVYNISDVINKFMFNEEKKLNSKLKGKRVRGEFTEPGKFIGLKDPTSTFEGIVEQVSLPTSVNLFTGNTNISIKFVNEKRFRQLKGDSLEIL